MDRNTEQKISQIANVFTKEEMAIILVTHRVQSAKLADRIYINWRWTINYCKMEDQKNLLKWKPFFSFNLQNIPLITFESLSLNKTEGMHIRYH